MRRAAALALALGLGLAPVAARAGGLAIDPRQLSNFQQAISDSSLLKPIFRTIGLFTAQRPYEPATPLGTSIGFDVGLTATMVSIPQSFIDALGKLGSSSTASFPRVAPVPILQIHKGLGPRFDIGLSYFKFQEYKIYGLDAKLAIWVPEEGPTFAVRLGYSMATVSFLKTKTLSPQILASRRLDFADPYIGIGLDFVSGELGHPDLPGLTLSGSDMDLQSFLGVQLKIPETGIQITLEGSYSTAGTHTMGTKIGMGF